MTESPLMRIGAALCSVAGSNADVERRFAARRRMMRDPSRSTLEEDKWHGISRLQSNLRLFDKRLTVHTQKQYVYVGEGTHANVSGNESGISETPGYFGLSFTADDWTDEDQTALFTDEDVMERAISPVPQVKRARQQEKVHASNM